MGRIRASVLPASIVALVLVASLLGGSRVALNTKLTSLCGYGYGSGGPTVTNVAPNRGTTAGGTTVVITGTNFCIATAVSFGGTAATSFVIDSDTQITAVSPAHAVGVVDVRVTNIAGTSPVVPADKYHYLPQSVFKPHPPQRLLDTRSSGQHMHTGTSITLHIGAGMPANATAVTLNVTATNTSTRGFLTVYPTGGSRPNASNLNWAAHQTVPNLVVVGIGAGGDVTFFNATGNADILVDLEGWYQPFNVATDGEFVPLSPHRITDTRTGSGQPNSGHHLGAGATLNVQVTGAGGVPAVGAESVILNITVTRTTRGGFLTAYPTGTTRPNASNLNWGAGVTIANRVSVPLGTGGKVTVFNSSGTTDVIVDVNGYFTDAAHTGSFFYPLTPARILDTRHGSRVGPNSTIAVAVAGQGGVPLMSDPNPPTAVVINVTATSATARSFLTIFPNGTARPTASDQNFKAGQTVPNLDEVQLGSNGFLSVYNSFGKVHVLVDVSGWYGS